MGALRCIRDYAAHQAHKNMHKLSTFLIVFFICVITKAKLLPGGKLSTNVPPLLQTPVTSLTRWARGNRVSPPPCGGSVSFMGDFIPIEVTRVTVTVSVPVRLSLYICACLSVCLSVCVCPRAPRGAIPAGPNRPFRPAGPHT